MSGKSISRYALIALALFLIGGLLMVDSNAQKRKRKRRSSAPKITNPEIYQPGTNENTNSNNSGDTTSDNANSNASPTPVEDPGAMKKTIQTLSNQVDKLSDKLNQMEESQRSMVDLERLGRAEQRSAQLRTEQRQVQEKIGELEVRLEDVEFALKPENVERATQGYGTTRPEELRAQRKKQLETERDRVQKQLEQLRASETNLMQAIATSDAEVDRLQKKIDAADRSAIENAKTKELAQPAPSPTPTPNR